MTNTPEGSAAGAADGGSAEDPVVETTSAFIEALGFTDEQKAQLAPKKETTTPKAKPAKAEEPKVSAEPKDEEDDSVREDHFQMPKGGVGLDEVSDKDWMELTWRLAHRFPDEFFHVFRILTSRSQAAEEAAGPVAEPKDGSEGATDGPKPAGRAPAEESAL